jgi:hypothetical protein
MTKAAPSQWNLSRRAFAAGAATLAMHLGAVPRMYAAEVQTLDRRFDDLSKNGNSTCSPTFTESISEMPMAGRLKGSCCSPMDRHRYGEQIEALKKYSGIEAIPPDPYDIAAGAAQKAMSYYDLALSVDEDKAYQYAMANSDEKGPCCCQCWRWQVYGGLGKLLIREHGFTGEQLVEVWNLSSGCGGGAEHHHG